jgi:hypothetical protein
MKRTIGIFIFVAQMTVGSHPTDADTPKSRLRQIVYAVEALADGAIGNSPHRSTPAS